VVENTQGFVVNNSTMRAQNGSPQINHHHIFIKLLDFCPSELPQLSLLLSAHPIHTFIHSCEHRITFSSDTAFEMADTGHSRLQQNITILREEEVSGTIRQTSMEILSKDLK
jgi:hypothetical protein